MFLFVTTGFIYETQHAHNPGIHNYIDALYFTVAALTTTGFGDITLPGTLGRLISIIIMRLIAPRLTEDEIKGLAAYYRAGFR